jgi:hypothetical protein
MRIDTDEPCRPKFWRGHATFFMLAHLIE